MAPYRMELPPRPPPGESLRSGLVAQSRGAGAPPAPASFALLPPPQLAHPSAPSSYVAPVARREPEQQETFSFGRERVGSAGGLSSGRADPDGSPYVFYADQQRAEFGHSEQQAEQFFSGQSGGGAALPGAGAPIPSRTNFSGYSPSSPISGRFAPTSSGLMFESIGIRVPSLTRLPQLSTGIGSMHQHQQGLGDAQAPGQLGAPRLDPGPSAHLGLCYDPGAAPASASASPGTGQFQQQLQVAYPGSGEWPPPQTLALAGAIQLPHRGSLYNPAMQVNPSSRSPSAAENLANAPGVPFSLLPPREFLLEQSRLAGVFEKLTVTLDRSAKRSTTDAVRKAFCDWALRTLQLQPRLEKNQHERSRVLILLQNRSAEREAIRDRIQKTVKGKHEITHRIFQVEHEFSEKIEKLQGQHDFLLEKRDGLVGAALLGRVLGEVVREKKLQGLLRFRDSVARSNDHLLTYCCKDRSGFFFMPEEAKRQKQAALYRANRAEQARDRDRRAYVAAHCKVLVHALSGSVSRTKSSSFYRWRNAIVEHDPLQHVTDQMLPPQERRLSPRLRKLNAGGSSTPVHLAQESKETRSSGGGSPLVVGGRKGSAKSLVELISTTSEERSNAGALEGSRKRRKAPVAVADGLPPEYGAPQEDAAFVGLFYSSRDAASKFSQQSHLVGDVRSVEGSRGNSKRNNQYLGDNEDEDINDEKASARRRSSASWWQTALQGTLQGIRNMASTTTLTPGGAADTYPDEVKDASLPQIMRRGVEAADDSEEQVPLSVKSVRATSAARSDVEDADATTGDPDGRAPSWAEPSDSTSSSKQTLTGSKQTAGSSWSARNENLAQQLSAPVVSSDEHSSKGLLPDLLPEAKIDSKRSGRSSRPDDHWITQKRSKSCSSSGTNHRLHSYRNAIPAPSSSTSEEEQSEAGAVPKIENQFYFTEKRKVEFSPRMPSQYTYGSMYTPDDFYDDPGDELLAEEAEDEREHGMPTASDDRDEVEAEDVAERRDEEPRKLTNLEQEYFHYEEEQDSLEEELVGDGDDVNVTEPPPPGPDDNIVTSFEASPPSPPRPTRAPATAGLDFDYEGKPLLRQTNIRTKSASSISSGAPAPRPPVATTSYASFGNTKLLASPATASIASEGPLAGGAGAARKKQSDEIRDRWSPISSIASAKDKSASSFVVQLTSPAASPRRFYPELAPINSDQKEHNLSFVKASPSVLSNASKASVESGPSTARGKQEKPRPASFTAVSRSHLDKDLDYNFYSERADEGVVDLPAREQVLTAGKFASSASSSPGAAAAGSGSGSPNRGHHINHSHRRQRANRNGSRVISKNSSPSPRDHDSLINSDSHSVVRRQAEDHLPTYERALLESPPGTADPYLNPALPPIRTSPNEIHYADPDPFVNLRSVSSQRSTTSRGGTAVSSSYTGNNKKIAKSKKISIHRPAEPYRSGTSLQTLDTGEDEDEQATRLIVSTGTPGVEQAHSLDRTIPNGIGTNSGPLSGLISSQKEEHIAEPRRGNTIEFNEGGEAAPHTSEEPPPLQSHDVGEQSRVPADAEVVERDESETGDHAEQDHTSSPPEVTIRNFPCFNGVYVQEGDEMWSDRPVFRAEDNLIYWNVDYNMWWVGRDPETKDAFAFIQEMVASREASPFLREALRENSSDRDSSEALQQYLVSGEAESNKAVQKLKQVFHAGLLVEEFFDRGALEQAEKGGGESLRIFFVPYNVGGGAGTDASVLSLDFEDEGAQPLAKVFSEQLANLCSIDFAEG